MNREKQQKIADGIWLAAMLLALLAMLSWPLLAGELRTSAFYEQDNVLELSTEILDEVSVPLVSASGSSECTGSNSSVRSAGTSDPGYAQYFWVGDDEGRWGTYRSVDVFSDSYLNDAGEVTVESANGDRVVAPGTSGVYNFSLKNTGSQPVAYKLHLDTVFESLLSYVPVRVRLRGDGEWLLGTQNDWVMPDLLLEYEEEGILSAKRYKNYSFEWKWPYEDEEASHLSAALASDRSDTALGLEHVSFADTRFILNISAVAASVTDNGPKTGDGRPWLLYGVITAVGAGGCIWWVITAKRKRDEEENG